jgi:hypothetical protein
MVPGVMLSGVNVGGSASGQQLTATVRGGASSQNRLGEGGQPRLHLSHFVAHFVEAGGFRCFVACS